MNPWESVQVSSGARAEGTDLLEGHVCNGTQHHRSKALTAGAGMALPVLAQKESVLPTPWGLLLGLWDKGEVSSSRDPHKTLQPQRCFPKFYPTRSASCFLACSITDSLLRAQVDHDGMVQVQSSKMGRKLSERRKDWNEASNDAVSMATTLLHSFNPLFQAAIPGCAGNHTTAAHILFLTHLLIKIIIPYREIVLNGSGWSFG